MLSIVNGRVLEIYPDSLVVGLGGIGLQVFVPAPLRDRLHPGDEIFLHTYLAVRQDALNLYGFETRDERELFVLLLQVDGIGPRSALAVLSTLTPDAIRRAIFHEQPEVFTRVPGVGKKTAQKILLQLQDRIPVISGLEPSTAFGDEDAEVIAALTALGYSVVEAQAALQSIPRDTPPDIETRLRAALQYFS
ncbi:MAG: Holliday junction branch migration protein RuvA [Anaerolineales bacterium]|jgi:Holliday junction DNA helicase RuvA|nr:Holliday junction branch migration protein RuvA [Anaerolineales bacterium]